MKYDFDKIIPRRGSNSYKWDSMPASRDILPLWVADMDFRTAPAIIAALSKRYHTAYSAIHTYQTNTIQRLHDGLSGVTTGPSGKNG